MIAENQARVGDHDAGQGARDESNIDQPMTPSAKGDRSFNLYMNKVSAETIKKERLQILEAGQEDIRKLADVVEAVMKAGQICVIGSEEKIEEAKDMFKNVTTF